MANDSYDINIKGLGTRSAAGKIDTSSIDTSNFQKSLNDLTSGIQQSAISAKRFVENMQKIEAKLSASLKAGLPSKDRATKVTTTDDGSVIVKYGNQKTANNSDARNSEKFIKTIDGLSSAIDKLTSGIKDNFKTTAAEEKPEEKKNNLVSDVKKILAAVGIGAIAKQIAENEIVNPAKATGMLISSNVVSNPRQIGSDLLTAY